MKESSTILIRVVKNLLIVLFMFFSLVLLTGSFLIRITLPGNSWLLWIPALLFCVFAVAVLLRLIKVFRLQMVYLAGVFFVLTGALFAFDMAVTRKSSALMMTTPLKTPLYSLQPPSEFKLVEQNEKGLRFSLGEDGGKVVLRVFQKGSNLPGHPAPEGLLKDYIGSAEFAACCTTISQMENGNLNGFPIVSIDYQTGPEKCRLSFIQGRTNYHLLEFCALSAPFADNLKRFNFFRASITRVQ